VRVKRRGAAGRGPLYVDRMNEAVLPIILLEDDASLRSLMTEGLREAGHGVQEVSTGAGAQAALAAVEGRAILVADRTIEGAGDGPNGFQIAADALERYPALKVIYISGTHIAIRRRTLGPRERALLKPFAMTQLMGAVRDLCR
jgi:DNA-binding NtrC family response regulator